MYEFERKKERGRWTIVPQVRPLHLSGRFSNLLKKTIHHLRLLPPRPSTVSVAPLIRPDYHTPIWEEILCARGGRLSLRQTLPGLLVGFNGAIHVFLLAIMFSLNRPFLQVEKIFKKSGSIYFIFVASLPSTVSPYGGYSSHRLDLSIQFPTRKFWSTTDWFNRRSHMRKCLAVQVKKSTNEVINSDWRGKGSPAVWPVKEIEDRNVVSSTNSFRKKKSPFPHKSAGGFHLLTPVTTLYFHFK